MVGRGVRVTRGRLWATPIRRRLTVVAVATLLSVGLVSVLLTTVFDSGSGAASGRSGSNAMPNMPTMPNMPNMPNMTALPDIPDARVDARSETSRTVTTPTVSTAGYPSGERQTGIFTDRCAYSHEAADDPILAPNDPGAAMHHNFYGNTPPPPPQPLPHWSAVRPPAAPVPTPRPTGRRCCYQNGTALTPSAALIYWRKPSKDAQAVQSVPVGLQMIAGTRRDRAPIDQRRRPGPASNQTGTGRPPPPRTTARPAPTFDSSSPSRPAGTGTPSPATARPTSSTAPPPDARARTRSRSRRSCSTSTTPPQAQPDCRVHDADHGRTRPTPNTWTSSTAGTKPS